MPPKFGTSGLRGLVADLTPNLISSYVKSFLATCNSGKALYIGRDLRPSSPSIASIVINSAQTAGVDVVDCGAVPTPALALAAIDAGASAIMVTGSHIPADRNGLKFYTPNGEISKTDETAILAGLGTGTQGVGKLHQRDVRAAYTARYLNAFGKDALAGLKIGAYTHSTVGRDLMIETIHRLGAEVTEVGRSDSFVPVDTEAIPEDVRQKLTEWALPLDAIISMDGDGDRPLMADENGQIVAGDIMGQVTALAMNAGTVVTPISSNTGVHLLGFGQVINTRIGSPFVIEAMYKKVACVGYEANGGFLLGFETSGLSPLMTRDSLLPIIATLALSKGRSVSAVVADQPQRFTAANRLQNIPTDISAKLVREIKHDPSTLLTALNLEVVETDATDGIRLICNNAIVHLRPSGNAPELRLYVEAGSKCLCKKFLKQGLEQLNLLLTV